VSFTEDVAGALGENASAALARLRAIAANPLVPCRRADDVVRLQRLCRDLFEETSLAREGYEVAARSYLALIGVETARSRSRPRTRRSRNCGG
jgi:AraC family transcriptional activator of pobA